MPLMSVPFKLPAPYPLPVGLTDAWQRQSLEQNVSAIVSLLVDEGIADLALLERCDGESLRVTAVHSRQADAFQALAGAVDPMTPEQFAMQALEAGSPLLVMGDVEPTEGGLRPEFVQAFLAGRPQADIGFAYVLPLIGASGTRHGVLTLVRGDGPLNHDQPAIVQALGQWLAHRFDSSAQ